MIDLSRVVASASELDPLPVTATRLAEVLGREETGFDEIERIVTFDPALTARLLRFANGASTAGHPPVATVQAAISRLGTGAVLSLAVGAALRRLLHRGDAELRGETALWNHSVAAALAARDLNRYCRHRIPPEAFTAALLHDIGKLILARFLCPKVRGQVADAMAAGTPPLEAERETLGVDHAEVGALVAEHWRLPDPLVLAIRYHHHPWEGMHTVSWAAAAANWATHSGTVTPWEIASLEVPLGLTPERFQALSHDVAAGAESFLAEFEAACVTA